MTRSLRALVIMTNMAAPVALMAQVAMPAETGTTRRAAAIGVSGGISLPVGDAGETLSTGYSVAGHLHFAPAALMLLRLRGDVSFDRWGIDGSNGNVRSLAFVGNALYDFPVQSTVMARPYVLGGVGAYNTKDSDFGVADTHVGVQLGGGVGYMLTGFATFAEVKFVNVFREGGSLRYIPITVGVRF
jgi:hypothetical protein